MGFSDYTRVIPRDLFNDANLLKCIGKLVLDIHDGKLPWMIVEHDEHAFRIYQDDSSGATYVGNVKFYAGDALLRFTRPLNSRDAWALYLETDDNAFPVFDDAGNIILTVKQALAAGRQ